MFDKEAVAYAYSKLQNSFLKHILQVKVGFSFSMFVLNILTHKYIPMYVCIYIYRSISI